MIGCDEQFLPAPFSDVGGVHAANMRTLQLLGVVEGVTAERYEPQLLVRRDQLASMLARMLGLDPVAEGPFTDIAGNVHAGAIRDQAASMLARALDRLDRPGTESEHHHSGRRTGRAPSAR